MKHYLLLAAAVVAGAAATSDVAARENPFLKPFDTQFEIAPYENILVEDFIPAIKAGIEEQDANIRAIVMNRARPDFDNTILPLENVNPILERVAGVYYLYDGALSTPEFAALAEEAVPLFNEASNRINLNDQLFARIKQVYDDRDNLGMTPTQKRLTEKYYREFAEQGAALPADKKAELIRINDELAQLFIQFNKNLLAATNAFYVTASKDEVAGLPESSSPSPPKKQRNAASMDTSSPSTPPAVCPCSPTPTTASCAAKSMRDTSISPLRANSPTSPSSRKSWLCAPKRLK